MGGEHQELANGFLKLLRFKPGYVAIIELYGVLGYVRFPCSQP